MYAWVSSAADRRRLVVAASGCALPWRPHAPSPSPSHRASPLASSSFESWPALAPVIAALASHPLLFCCLRTI